MKRSAALSLIAILACSCATSRLGSYSGSKEWKFYSAHEFSSDCKGVPAGFTDQRGGTVNRDAKVDNNRCVWVSDGVLHIGALKLSEPVDNGYGKQVGYIQGAIRSAAPDSKDFWCRFTENMRVEVRVRRDPATGINDAVWFMPNAKIKWPAGGEIDLLENPKKKLNDRAHFTLHSEHHYSGPGGTGSITSITKVDDMSKWHVYWMEWYPDRILGGVDDNCYFTHYKGDTQDWPWNDEQGFYLILSRGLSTDASRWMGAVDPSEPVWNGTSDGPKMEIDWIRVYTNKNYSGQKAPKRKFY